MKIESALGRNWSKNVRRVGLNYRKVKTVKEIKEN